MLNCHRVVHSVVAIDHTIIDTYLHLFGRHPIARILVHELLQIIVEKLKDQEKLAITVQYFNEIDDVGMA